MITPSNLASDVSIAGENFVEALGKYLSTAKDECPPEEYERFRKAIGSVIGTLEIEMLWPLYRQHPDLEPENLRDWRNET